jgi:Arc/MetJ-type ribon-helix-helix transcriptional regulator
MPQLVTRIDAQLAEAIDQLVSEGIVASRSEAVRMGLEQLVDRATRAEIAAAIHDG